MTQFGKENEFPAELKSEAAFNEFWSRNKYNTNQNSIIVWTPNQGSYYTGIYVSKGTFVMKGIEPYKIYTNSSNKQIGEITSALINRFQLKRIPGYQYGIPSSFQDYSLFEKTVSVSEICAYLDSLL